MKSGGKPPGERYPFYGIMLKMSNNKLIFDIETVGVDYDSLDEYSRESLEKYAETEEELAEVRSTLGISPLTGEIVAIGILNPETDKGAIYIRTDAPLPAEVRPGVALETGTEKEILQKFWETAEHYQQFISFNGRCFDIPFLFIRSAVLDVRPSKNLMANRYLGSQPASALQIDLLDQLSFYGAFRGKRSLHFWCRAFGIKSPKEDGVTGDDVFRLMQEGKCKEIAEYNLGDLVATKALYEKWLKYLAF